MHFLFQKYIPQKQSNNLFDNMLKMFLGLSNRESGDISKALSSMQDLDKWYKFTNSDYGMGDFIEDLKNRGYIKEYKNEKGSFELTHKSEHAIRRSALEEIFGKLKRGNDGFHSSPRTGKGSQLGTDLRKFEFGDTVDQIDFRQSIQNASKNQDWDKQFRITERDIEVTETERQTSVSTVLLIDISHSMVLYGEDRITPAKKVAMALTELIQEKYKKDTLDFAVFGNDAWQISAKDLPYLKVGPFYTNTVAGLELAISLLRKRKTRNKQIFMITDGKPTCLKEGPRYYQNSFGLDPKIINKTLNLAAQCRRLQIPITTFMIARDPYLKRFVKDFTQANQGSAYYSTLEGLGNLVFEDFRKRRTKRIR